MIDHVLAPFLRHRVRVGQVPDETVLQVVERVLVHALAQSNHLVVGDARGVVALLADKASIAVGVERGDVHEGLEWPVITLVTWEFRAYRLHQRTYL